MPFQSKAQQRFMFAAESRGDVPKGTAERWAHETPGMRHLPERVHDTAHKSMMMRMEAKRRLAGRTKPTA